MKQPTNTAKQNPPLAVTFSFCPSHQSIRVGLGQHVLALNMSEFFLLCHTMDEFRCFLQEQACLPLQFRKQ